MAMAPVTGTGRSTRSTAPRDSCAATSTRSLWPSSIVARSCSACSDVPTSPTPTVRSAPCWWPRRLVRGLVRLRDAPRRSRRLRPGSLADARFCESVESAHSDHDQSAQIAARLGITTEPFRVDSQCKYAAVAAGRRVDLPASADSQRLPREDLGPCRRQVRGRMRRWTCHRRQRCNARLRSRPPIGGQPRGDRDRWPFPRRDSRRGATCTRGTSENASDRRADHVWHTVGSTHDDQYHERQHCERARYVGRSTPDHSRSSDPPAAARGRGDPDHARGGRRERPPGDAVLDRQGQLGHAAPRARRRSFRRKPPFPLVHVDTTWKFSEMYAFRDADRATTRPRPDRAPEPRVRRTRHQPVRPRLGAAHRHVEDRGAQAGDRQATSSICASAAPDATRRSRAPRSGCSRSGRRSTSGIPKRQRPELWQIYNGRRSPGETLRVFPISNWTELDVWQYVHLEQIPIVPLYLAAPRPVVDRGRRADHGRRRPHSDSTTARCPRSSRCASARSAATRCRGRSRATPTPSTGIIQEMLLATTSERQGRVIDFDGAASMEKKKQEGYF